MTEKMLGSTDPEMSRSSSHPSMLELVWENGQVLFQGSSSNRKPKNPSCFGYSSINPSGNKEAMDLTKRARLSTFGSFPAQRDSNLSSSHSHQSTDQCSNQTDLQFSSHSKSSSSNKLKQDFANIGQVKESKLTGEPHHQPPATTTTGNHSPYSPLFTYSSQKLLPSSLKKPRKDSSQIQTQTQTQTQAQATNSQKKVNFFNFLIPEVFLKSSYHHHHQRNTSNNASSARLEEINEAGKVEKAAPVSVSNKAPHHDQSEVMIGSSPKGSNVLTGFQDQTFLAANKPYQQVSVVAGSDQLEPLDEHSEAVVQNKNSALRLKGKGKAADTDMCDEPLLASSPVCSLGASNNPNFCPMKHEDTDDSLDSSDNGEEPEIVVKETPAREGNRVKRNRNADIRNLSERKRRDKINKKILTLKELIPNCNKMDKASTLDDAINYLKTLKLQLQIMSMGSGLCMPLMMLPAATSTHQINTPHLPQLMGFGPARTSLFPCTPPQYTIPPFTDNTNRMFGFSNQMPPVPISHPPFIPMIGNSSTQPPLPTGTAINNSVEHVANSPQSTTLEASFLKNSHLHATK